ncbi:MAG TPA: phospholipase D-like domain-containing protein [Vicinamibacterales bacterium]|nr:phospholipase D-like domain-containing protein [Vicinamibacterales bacterium]
MLITQPDAGIAPIVQAIRRAKQAVHVCIFRFDRPEVEKALAAAVERGVRVRALIAHTNRGGEAGLRKLEQRLLDAGLTVTRTPDDLRRYHGKFLVADDMLHVFGFNFTKLDIDKSRSFGIATRDKRTIQEALKLFEADVTRTAYQPSRSNLVVSPETSRTMLGAFLKGARKDLSIYDEKIQDPAMIKILKDLAGNGVRVRVLGDLEGPDGDVVVRPLKTLRLHVRAIVRDGMRAFVGSQSLRQDELDKRREVGLLINSRAVTRSLLKVFDADWEASASKQERVA